jgi:beta-phosphoglucomutase-like phosphatase (HAD superfamily)
LLSNTLGADSESWFDCIGSGDIVPHKKPAPDIYEFVLKELGIDVSEAIALEDSYNGVKSTTAIDMFTLVTPNNYTAHETFEGAKIIVKNLGEPGKPCEKISGDYDLPEYINLAFLQAVL